MKNAVDKQYAPSVNRTVVPPTAPKTPLWEDNRPKFLSDSRLIAAIQRTAAPAAFPISADSKKTEAPTPLQRKSTSTVIQRFPSHRNIQVADGVITARELLKILDQIAQEEYARIQERGATDWFGQFAGLPDPSPYTFPAATPGLSYNHSSVRKTFQVGGVRLVNSGTNNYIHAERNPAAHDITSYPKLSDAIETAETNAGNLTPAGQKRRASQIRSYLAGPLSWQSNSPLPLIAGPPPGMPTHLALATAALFGAETSRSHRAYIPNMMLLDRLETQQPYGRTGTKRLTLPDLLNSRKYPGDSNAAFWQQKTARLNINHPSLLQNLTDASNPARTLDTLRGSRALHGGKAPMAGQWTQAMGKAPLPPTDLDPLNLVQAKEVNVLIHWLRLQLGLDVLANTKKTTALQWITALVRQRARNYYLMNGQARQSYFLSLARSSLQGGALFMQQFMIPMVRQLILPARPTARTFASSFAPSFRTTPLSPWGGIKTGGLPRSLSGIEKNVVAAAGAVTLSGSTNRRRTLNFHLLQGALDQIALLAGGNPFFLKVEGGSLQNQLQANWGELTRLYRQAALHTHPDKQKDKDDADFKKLQKRWELLKEGKDGKLPSEAFALEGREEKALT